MGNFFGQRLETPEQQQKRLEQSHGILMPPAFVNHGMTPISNTSNAAVPWTSSLLGQLQLYQVQAQDPNLVNYLWETQPGIRLCKDYYLPDMFGLTMKIPIHFGQGNVWIHLPHRQVLPLDTDNSDKMEASDPSPISGITHASLLADYRLANTTNLRLHFPTDPRAGPSLQFSQSLGADAGWSARLTSKTDIDIETTDTNKNLNWMEAKYKTQWNLSQKRVPESEHDVANLMASSYVTWNNNIKPDLQQTPFDAATFHLQGGMEYQETMLASKVQVPMTALRSTSTVWNEAAPQLTIDTMVAMNLNPQSKVHSEESHGPPAPPLWLTLKHQSKPFSPTPVSNWTLNLSQILTFDRVVLNPLEDRAPHIRQTLGWAIQVHPSNDKKDSAPSWSASATYQLNRAIAAKAVWTEGLLHYGAILKRWSAPRVTLSVWNAMDARRQKTTRPLWGFGLEVETDTIWNSSRFTRNESSADYPPAANLPNFKAAPPTKVQLP